MPLVEEGQVPIWRNAENAYVPGFIEAVAGTLNALAYKGEDSPTAEHFATLAGINTGVSIQAQLNGKVPTTRTINGQALTTDITLTTSNVAEGDNLYYTQTRFNAALALKSTTDLAEGTNLYYTSARFDTAFAAKSTTNLTEGTNLYYTQARFDSAFSSKSTTNLSEGVNLYYTQARFDSAFANKSTTNLNEGTNLYYTQARFDTAFSGKSTTNLAEGTNLYFTNTRARNAISSASANQISYNSTTGVIGTPQDIHSNATPTFAGATFTGNVLLNAAVANLYLKDTSTGLLSSSTTIVSLQTNNSFRSTSYTSGLVGWNISSGGNAEFNNVDVRGAIHAGVFVYNALMATAGTLGVFKSAAKLRSDVVIPASPTYGTTTVTIDVVDQDGLSHLASQLFAMNDTLRMKDGLVGDTWFQVSAVSDQGSFWRYTAKVIAGSAGVTYRAGLGVVDYGISGSGFITLTADQANAPYMQMATLPGGFSSTDAAGTLNITPQLRIGNLNGSYGFATDTYGFGTGQYGTTNKTWITVEQSNGIRIGNNLTTLGQWDISGNVIVGQVAAGQSNVNITAGAINLRNNVSTRIRLASDGSGYLANTSITWDTSGNLTMSGNATIAGWSISTASISSGGITLASSATAANNKIFVGTGTYNNINTPFYVDGSGQFSLKDQLSWNGTTLAITGNVTASAGAIGGWTINAASITSGGITLAANATAANNKIFVGVGTYNNTNTPFYVDGNGQFSLKDKFAWDGSTLAITGAITATSGSIAGTLTMSGGSSAITIGTTPPTSASSGTGIWLDRTGIYGLASNTVQAKLDGITGAIVAGAGNLKLDANGIAIIASTIFSQTRSYNFVDGSGTLLSNIYHISTGSPLSQNTLTIENLAQTGKNSIVNIFSESPTGLASTVLIQALTNGVPTSKINVSTNITMTGNVGIGNLSPSYSFVVGPDFGAGASAAMATFGKSSGSATMMVGNTASGFSNTIEFGWDNTNSRGAINAASAMALTIGGFSNPMIRLTSTGIGFFGAAAAAKPNLIGSRASGAALLSVIAAGVTLGLWTDSTSA